MKSNADSNGDADAEISKWLLNRQDFVAKLIVLTVLSSKTVKRKTFLSSSIWNALSKFRRKFNFKIFANFKKISSVYCFDLLSRLYRRCCFLKQINSHKRPCTAKRHMLMFINFCQFFFDCQGIFMKLCIRLTLIFKKRHDVPSSYAFKEQKKIHASASINSCKIPQNVFLQKLVQWTKPPSHHLPVQNQQ